MVNGGEICANLLASRSGMNIKLDKVRLVGNLYMELASSGRQRQRGDGHLFGLKLASYRIIKLYEI